MKPLIKPKTELKSEEIEKCLPQIQFKKVDKYRILRDKVVKSENK